MAGAESMATACTTARSLCVAVTYTDVSLPYPAGRYRTLGRGVSPPAPGADMPGTPDPRGAIAIWAPLFGFCYPVSAVHTLLVSYSSLGSGSSSE